MAGSSERVGTAHDNIIVESAIGSYKNDLICSGRRSTASC